MKGLSRNGSKTSKRSEMRKKLMCKETVWTDEAMSWSKTEPTVRIWIPTIWIPEIFEYSGGSNTERSKTESIQKPYVSKFGFRMVWFSNGWD